ncbi:hypothetical protein ACIRQF_07805 [Streptomyces sp. NPDC101191]|uniref:hypothetical protein n=1 Tax=Streptomyces sp. NPDC101191 TaxID=3366126 RepID=UPI0037FF0E25
MITSSPRVRAAVVGAATAAALVAAIPGATAAPYTDLRETNCVKSPQGGGCKRGTVAEYWHQGGARGIGWVYASKRPVTEGSTLYARWGYQTPGKEWKSGGGWKKAKITNGSTNHFAEVWWGRGGHTGPKVPKGTKVCSQYRGDRTWLCLTLK